MLGYSLIFVFVMFWFSVVSLFTFLNWWSWCRPYFLHCEGNCCHDFCEC